MFPKPAYIELLNFTAAGVKCQVAVVESIIAFVTFISSFRKSFLFDLSFTQKK